MGLKNFRPLTPSSRFKSLPSFSEITKDKPEKSLTAVRKRTGGRNNNGRLTMRHRGGGHKRKYRLVDFKRKKQGVHAEVLAINMIRTARPASRFSNTPMAKSPTSWPQSDSLSALG